MATKHCDWCKMRRKTESVEVVMSETANAYPIQQLWYQEWELCFQCVRACKAALGSLRVLSIGRPE